MKVERTERGESRGGRRKGLQPRLAEPARQWVPRRGGGKEGPAESLGDFRYGLLGLPRWSFGTSAMVWICLLCKHFLIVLVRGAQGT